MSIKIFIVDDHMVVREGLKLILETNDLFNVVGEASNGEELLSQIEEVSVDIILMDLNMPIMDGLETMKVLQEKNIQTPVIILTTYNEDKMMLQGMEMGAKGYLLKDTGREDLFRTIESATRGEILLQPEIMTRLIEAQKNKEVMEEDRLTEKEIVILRAASKGLRNKDIAYDLGIAERTVKAHFTNIFNKLNVSNRVEAVTRAVEIGLIDL